ncbi:Sulfotransferase 1C4 [Ooceraea biroi]|uniref:Sulfotransferase 1C4 n=1 Tax=Ooceraea biroi TaxID=2015173 RepID=A0A026W3D8_OOCBI|nr:Sulfotransferase 1C4 [Ooceraea biroi]
MTAQQLPKYELLPKEKTAELLKVFKGERTGWVLVGPKKYFFPYRYTEQGAGFYNFKARPDDTWVLSYPRSGTTWTQELVWLLSNNLDFDTAKKNLLAERFPFLELVQRKICLHKNKRTRASGTNFAQAYRILIAPFRLDAASAIIFIRLFTARIMMNELACAMSHYIA